MFDEVLRAATSYVGFEPSRAKLDRLKVADSISQKPILMRGLLDTLASLVRPQIGNPIWIDAELAGEGGLAQVENRSPSASPIQLVDGMAYKARLAEGLSILGFKVLNRLLSDQPGESQVISPFSLGSFFLALSQGEQVDLISVAR